MTTPSQVEALLGIAAGLERLAKAIERATGHGYLAINLTIDPDSDPLTVVTAESDE